MCVVRSIQLSPATQRHTHAYNRDRPFFPVARRARAIQTRGDINWTRRHGSQDTIETI